MHLQDSCAGRARHCRSSLSLGPQARCRSPRRSVRTLGGRIELDSSPGEGTIFRIVLARARVREEVPA